MEFGYKIWNILYTEGLLVSETLIFSSRMHAALRKFLVESKYFQTHYSEMTLCHYNDWN